MHSHTDGPTEAHRSWLWFQTACPFVASTPPRNNRSWPASALEPATARVASSQPRLRASSSVPPGNAPSSGLSGAAASSVHAVPHTLPGARSPHKRSAPWLALPCPPAEESSKSWSALSHSHSHSHGGSEPQPDRTLPRVGFLHCALQVVVAQDREHSTEIEKRSFMRFQKCLLAGVREGAMESSSAGHAPHAKHIGLLSLFPDVRVGFVPVHLGFLSPTVGLRNEHFLPYQLQLNFSLANVAANGRLGHLYLWHLRVNPLPDAMRCVSLLLGGLLVCFQNRLDEGSRRP